MKNICLLLFILTAIIGCGEKSKPQKKKQVVENKNETIVEFDWLNSVTDYEGKKVTVYGFLWFDSIQNVLPKGDYTIYERPNCYDCTPLKSFTNADLQITSIEDTTVENHIKGGQWRLVKITGTVQGMTEVNIERVELSEYSYPDYESSGYEKITDEKMVKEIPNNSRVYVDGKILYEKAIVESGVVEFKLVNKKIKSNVVVYLRMGNGPGQCNEPDPFPSNPIIIRDKNMRVMMYEDARLYGIWQTAKDTLGVHIPPSLFVEMIDSNK